MKLSKISIISVLFKKKEELKKIVLMPQKENNNIFDYAIVFGNKKNTKRLEKVIELYNKNLIKKIIISGGIGYLSLNIIKTEAEFMKEYLLNNRVKEEDIIIEDKSKDTKENVINTIKILNKDRNINNKKILLISSNYHIKRCYLLFIKLSSNKNIFITSSNDKITKYKLQKEIILMKYYLKNYQIDDFNISQ